MITTADKMIKCGVEINKASHIQFIRDMESNKFNIKLRSVYGYSGPCVFTSNRDAVLKATSVRCKVVPAGYSWIIHPVETCPIIAATVKTQPWLAMK